MVKIEKFKKRLFMCIIGVFFCGMSVGFFKRATFGIDPFQSFVTGLNEVIPISFGTLYMLVSACFLIFTLIADRHYIGLATLINLFLLGYIVQFSTDIIFRLFPEINIIQRLISLLIGLVILSLSSAFYFTADLGVSVYDAVALIIVNTWKKGKFKYVRITTDLCCVILGVTLYLAGGNKVSDLNNVVGFGTVIIALFMGPLTDFFNIQIAQPFLRGKK